MRDDDTNLFDLISTFLSDRPNRRVRIRMDVASPSACVVGGSESRWGAAVRSLLRGAFLVTPIDQPVDIVLRSSGEVVDLEVTDRGCGIPREDYSSVLEGPELDDVRHAVEAAGGSLSLLSSDRGTTFRLIVPTPSLAERAA
jgi:hypothetical protein